MESTTLVLVNPTITPNGHAQVASYLNDLVPRYQALLEDKKLGWSTYHRLLKLLGSGGQGVVYLSERRGANNFTLPVALKIFSPNRYIDERAYHEAMNRIAHVAARVAQIQQDNLLDVHDFVDRNRICMMVMEWIDGYDLHQLLVPEMMARLHGKVDPERWRSINEVIVTSGPVHPRVKPGVAVAIVRECLAALAALHREGIVHGDIKPSNIMLKQTGNAKLVDIGSAFEMGNAPVPRTCTPMYAAPEVLEGSECSPRSDLASLGYVLIEMLAGRPIFAGLTKYSELLEAKRFLAQRLSQILPVEVTGSQLLMNFCRGLVAPDPARRFPSAEAADMVKDGASAFHRQLIKGDLAAEYENEIRLWLRELKELDEQEGKV